MLPFVPNIVPGVVQALLLVIAFSFAFAKLLRTHPVPFYLVFLAFSVLAFFGEALAHIPALNVVVQAFSSAYTGVAFYLVVMFAGALKRTDPRVKVLLSIRSELSIIGGIVVAAHCVRVIYLPILAFSDEWGLIWGSAAPVMLLAMGVVGPLLLACFLLPWITSFKCVRRSMSHETWKKIQKLAYPFMFLMVAQGFLLAAGHAMYLLPYEQAGLLGPAWESDFTRYLVTAAAYLSFGASYALLKLGQRREREVKARQRAVPPAGLVRF